MTFQFGQDLEMDQLRTSCNISNLFSNPSRKKEVVTFIRRTDHDKPKLSQQRGAGSFSQETSPTHSPCSCKIINLNKEENKK